MVKVKFVDLFNSLSNVRDREQSLKEMVEMFEVEVDNQQLLERYSDIESNVMFVKAVFKDLKALSKC